MRKHHKISHLERDQIFWWHLCGDSIRKIARQLGRSPSTVSDELKRNSVDGYYKASVAQKAAEKRKQNSHQKYLLRRNKALSSFVLEKLRLGWSPQQIAGRLKKEIREGHRSPKDYINHESIYQYLYDPTKREERLFDLLPRHHRKRYRWLGRRTLSKIPHRISIWHRPEAISSRTEFGHWEGDTIVGYKHKTGLHTEVERVSRFACAVQIPHIRSKETFLAQLAIFYSFPREARKSTTLDNGGENYLHTRLQEELGMQIYFADPYSAWQRGTNESTNGLIRRFFPKCTDFRSVSQEQVNDVIERLNNTPRKVLNYQTPREVFSAYILQSVRIDS
jgi:IS30 family transposase